MRLIQPLTYLSGGDDAQGRDIAHGYVDHQAAAAIRARVRRVGNVQIGRSIQRAKLRLIGRQPDGPAHGAGAIQSSLGSA